MRIPGFSAQELCCATGGSYMRPTAALRAEERASGAERYSIAPAQDFFLTEDDSPAEGPEDVCKELEKCCRDGYVDCCIALKGCR